jgi:hypothetical protein
MKQNRMFGTAFATHRVISIFKGAKRAKNEDY